MKDNRAQCATLLRKAAKELDGVLTQGQAAATAIQAALKLVDTAEGLATNRAHTPGMEHYRKQPPGVRRAIARAQRVLLEEAAKVEKVPVTRQESVLAKRRKAGV